jgi:energy-coupling factor transporter ATP-binding protein EcfA2
MEKFERSTTQAQAEPSSAMIDVRGLSFCYSAGKSALDGVSFRVAEDERIAVLGPNGAGKSTLLLHLNGILPEPPLGKTAEAAVFVCGEAVAAPRLRIVRRQVGLLFQNPDDQLFCPTVLEDVAFGPLQLGLSAAEARRIALQALADVGLHGVEDSVPERLSFGQRKRACLAGVLACRPVVLALDEPSANLDPRGRRELLQLLSNTKATLVVATHDLDFAVRLCDRALVLDEGKVVANGPSREVMADAGLMEKHGLETPATLRGS